MIDKTPSRRSILKASGVALAGLAGCSGSPDDESGGQTRTPSDDGSSGDSQTDGHDDDHGHTDGGGDDQEGDLHDSGGHSHNSSLPEAPVESATVDMITVDATYHFAPHVIWVEPGATVTFVNDSGIHTATAYHPDNEEKPLRIPEEAEPWDSGTKTEQGATYEHTFEVEGVHDYYCKPHEVLGMIGSVIVGTPDPGTDPGLQTPQESMRDPVRAQLATLNRTVEDVLADSG